MSRDKFAPQTGISKTALVNYETGERIPPSDYLVKILELFPEISPAWLLMGEGNMWRAKAFVSGFWIDKIKQLRGDLSISDFAKKLKYTLLDKGIEELQAIEAGKIEPEFIFLQVLYEECGMNPEWMFRSDVPMLKKDLGFPDNFELDTNLLALVYEVIDDIDSDSHLLSNQQKAELFLLYII